MNVDLMLAMRKTRRRQRTAWKPAPQPKQEKK